MAALLALLASLSWGGSDFLGGLTSRRYPPVLVVGTAHAITLVTLVFVATGMSAWRTSAGYLPWAVAAGVVGLVGLVAFYQALASGTMGIVAPIAGTGAVVPVAVGLLQGDAPSGLQLAGIAAAVAGVVLASGPELSGKGRGGGRPLWLAGVAALAFGAVFVLIDKGAKHNVIMTLLAMRATSVVIIATLAAAFSTQRRRVRARMPAMREVAVIAVIGWTDAGANGLYGYATRHGLVSVTSVLASLYPAVTVVLARVFQHERMRRIQDAGVALAMCGVVLLAAG